MTGIDVPELLHREKLDARGNPTGYARCDKGDGTFPGGLLAHNSGMANCEACEDWEPDHDTDGQDDEEPRIVLSNKDFDGLTSTLDQPPHPVPELVGLFRGPRLTPPADEAGGYETDPVEGSPPGVGDHGTCAYLVGRGAEGTAVCGYEITLRSKRTVLMADGTDGHGAPGGREILVWRHTDVAIDYMYRAQTGGRRGAR